MGTPRRSLMFRLGQFFGHVARGATGPLGPGSGGTRRVLRQDMEERSFDERGATVTLRRTTIEEVEVRPDAQRGTGGASAHQQEGTV